MARLLLIHPSSGAIERERGEELLAGLRHAELEVECCGSKPGLAWLDRQLAISTRMLLIDPIRWWPRSSEDLLRRPWLARIRDHVEFDRRNRLGGVAGIVDRGRPTNEAFEGLPWFRWRGEWEALLDWADAPSRSSSAFDFAIGPAIPGDRRRDDLLAAIDARLAASTGRVAVTGSIGAGKTRLLRDWLRRGTADWIVAHHFALPEHGATLRADRARRSLAAQLDPNATDLAEAIASRAADRPGAAIVLVVDGLERIADADALLALPDLPGDVQVRWLIGARPDAVPPDADTIDLDGSWASGPTLIAALVADVPRLADADRQALIERAAGNPGYVAALAEDASTRASAAQLQAQTKPAVEGKPPVLPRRFEAELARAVGRLLELPIADRRRADRILDLLALAGEPLRASIVLACVACLDGPSSLASAIEPVRALIRIEAHESEPSLALWHPAFAESRRMEIDPGCDLERVLVEGIRAANAEVPAGLEAQLVGRRDDLTQLRADVDDLVECLRSGGPLALEQRLELGGEPAGDLLALVRAQRASLVASPDMLPSTLWNGLIDRGWTNQQLTERLRWSALPKLRSRRALEHVDRCWRSLPHPDDVHACAISSNGELVLSGCDDGWVRAWSRTTGELVSSFEHGGLVRACAITPDGRWAVSGGSNGELERWDLQTRTAAGACQLGKGRIVTVAIDDAGARVIAGDSDGKLIVWRTIEAKGKPLPGHSDQVAGVAISADGKLGLSAGKLDVVVWNLDTHARVVALPKHEYSIYAIAIDPDGRTGYSLAIGEWWQFSSSSGAIEKRVQIVGANVECCTPLGSGRLLVGQNNELAIWDMAAGAVVQGIHAHLEVEACAATRDGRWLVSAGERSLKIWPADAFDPSTTARWTGARSLLATSPDGTRAIVGGDEHELSVVDLASGKIPAKLAIGGRTTAIAWIDDDRLLTAGATSHQIAIWSVSRRKQLAIAELGSDWLRGVAISPDRTHALICGDENKTWWIDLRALDDPTVVLSHGDWAHACRFSSDGRTALSVDRDAELRTWSFDDDAQRQRLKSNASHTYHSLATVDRFAFAGGNASLDVWDFEAGKLLASPAGHVGKVQALTIAHGGRVLVSAGDDATLRLWKIGRSPTLLATVQGHAPFTSVAVTDTLLLAGDGAGNLWELEVDWGKLE